MEDLETLSRIFNSLKLKSYELRKESISIRKIKLKKLKHWINKNVRQLSEAAYADLGKPEVEFNAIEILYVLNEIEATLNSLDQWTKPELVDATLEMFGTRSSIIYEPRGVCLIIAPWNYPFSLCVGPLVSAIAAGNVIILKPSEITTHISSEIKRMATEVFDSTVVYVAEGGEEISNQLLKLPFDHIFFTGSSRVGKIVMKAAAEHLTSITLELGGKSPAIVTRTARIKEAAQRIAVSKFVNAGQTCVAPDYVLIDERSVKEFIKHLIHFTKHHFANKSDFTKIATKHHFERLTKLVNDAVKDGASIVYKEEGDASTQLFSPVILTDVSITNSIMQEEIFGPVLPVVTYSDFDEAIGQINTHSKPLGLYIFSQSSNERKELLYRTSSGGACINDCAIQFLHNKLPFGGVNSSGIGKSHGHAGFLAFSNIKPVLIQRNGFTVSKLLYPPYKPLTSKILNVVLRLFHR